MAEIELRVIDYNKLMQDHVLSQMKDACISHISFGSETCYHQLPQQDTIAEILEKTRGFKRTFIFPILFEAHFDKVAALADNIIGNVEKVCVNDYGLLEYLWKNFGTRLKEVILGSGISFSYEECPWHGHIIKDEPPELRESILISNYDSICMHEILEKYDYNFTIEVPALNGVLKSSRNLKNAGYKITVLAHYIPVSIARACHTCRYLGLKLNSCGLACKHPYLLSPTKRWDFIEGDVKAIRPIIREQMPQFIVFGNAIFVKNNQEKGNELVNDIAERIVTDLRFYDSIPSAVNATTETYGL